MRYRTPNRTPISFHITPKEAEVFWARVVQRGECWEWDAGASGGYGAFYVARLGHQLRAHRVAYVITHGSIPKGLYVLHNCNNPPCVNPKHLRAGTASTPNNTQRRQYRKSDARRPGNRSKLTPARVKDIRRRAETGETYALIAERYGITQTHVGNVVRRKSWKHL